MTSDNLTTLRPAKSSRKTLTEAAEEGLRQAITQGTFRPGSQLPTESELVQMLGVSRTVVREALRILQEDGLIARRHGVGTFVRREPILKNLNLNFGITEMIQSAGMTPGTSHVAVHVEPANAEIVEQLRLAPEAEVISVERVRTADGKPVVYSLDIFSANQVRGGAFNPDRLEKESLYNILETDFGIVIEYGVARILPAKPPAHVAKKLALAEDSVVLCIDQTDYSPTDEPLLYSREYHLPDAFEFLIWRRGTAKLRTPNSG